MLRFSGLRSEHRRSAIEDGYNSLPGVGAMAEYRKRTTIYAVRIDEPFQVHTIEGLMDGAAGDFLACGAAGELYPIAADVFAATYEPVE